MLSVPDWFQVLFTGFEHSEEIPCIRKVPEESLSLGGFCFGFSPGWAGVETFCVSGNLGKPYFILRAGGCEKRSDRWVDVPAA